MSTATVFAEDRKSREVSLNNPLPPAMLGRFPGPVLLFENTGFLAGLNPEGVRIADYLQHCPGGQTLETLIELCCQAEQQNTALSYTFPAAIGGDAQWIDATILSDGAGKVVILGQRHPTV